MPGSQDLSSFYFENFSCVQFFEMLIILFMGMSPKQHSKLLGDCGNNNASFSATGFVLFQSVRYCHESIGGAKGTITTKNTDGATLYENVLTIQNAADLEWPAPDPANAVVRGEFLLGIFPPDHGGNHAPPAPPVPPTAPAK
jgi:hypothetical protein